MIPTCDTLLAPFPYFGGKRTVADEVWQRFGTVKQYIEPFCGSAAILLSAPTPASLEVVCDANGYIANFWRAVKHQPAAVAEAADYPVSHVDLGARHAWLTDPVRVSALATGLADPEWPGDARIAGWWVWGQCCWIGSGWCDWFRAGQVPHASDAGRGVQAAGQVPHASNAGRGVQAAGQVPHASDAGRGVFPLQPQYDWMQRLSARLYRVRVGHGDWSRFLNHHYGGNSTAAFLDPPYRAYTKLYGCACIADQCEAWARDNANLRVALCGHIGDYDLPGWEQYRWSRGRMTYGSDKTTALDCVWFSPACLLPPPAQLREQELFPT